MFWAPRTLRQLQVQMDRLLRECADCPRGLDYVIQSPHMPRAIQVSNAAMIDRLLANGLQMLSVTSKARLVDALRKTGWALCAWLSHS